MRSERITKENYKLRKKRKRKTGKKESHHIDKTTHIIGNNFSGSEKSPLQLELPCYQTQWENVELWQ